MCRLICFFTCLFATITQVHAAQIKVETSGIINSADGHNAAFNPITTHGIKVGDSFSYQFVFTERSEQELIANPGLDLNSITSFSGQAGGFSFSGASGLAAMGPLGEKLGNQILVDHEAELFGRDDFTTASGPIAELKFQSVIMDISGGKEINNNDLSRVKLNIPIIGVNGGFNIFILKFTGLLDNVPVEYDARGSVDILSFSVLDDTPSLVPVPATIWLLGTGLLGIFGFKKKRIYYW